MQKKNKRRKKMNLKRNLLMILLPIALTLTLSTQTLKESKKNLDNDLGIDLTKTYKGNEVQQIIDIILEEADLGIESAYKEGYKQATVELQPQIEYWKTLFQENQILYQKEKLQYNLTFLGAGLIVGSGITGIIFSLKI